VGVIRDGGARVAAPGYGAGMTSKETEPLIASEADLVARTGYPGQTPVEDWLGELCELADWFERDGDETCFHITMCRYPPSAQYTVQLSYPFPLAALEEEAERAEMYFRGAIHAASLADGESIGDPALEDDVTSELATDVLGADPEDLVAVLGETWVRMDFDVDRDDRGETIYAWFVPSGDRMVGLGVGADALHVVPLLGSDAEGFEVGELPEPTVSLWWAGEWTGGVPQEDPAGTLASLRQAIAMVAGSPAGTSPSGSNDHEVRLSTKNLLLAGIDLDFEVKRGGSKRGTLSVSEGGLLWRPAGAHRRRGRAKSGIKISWSQFADWAES
jgi:hypothetical protein